MGHHEITEKSGGLRAYYSDLRNERFSVILEVLNQHEITIYDITAVKLKQEKSRPF